jgi:hypothetical protein
MVSVPFHCGRADGAGNAEDAREAKKDSSKILFPGRIFRSSASV